MSDIFAKILMGAMECTIHDADPEKVAERVAKEIALEMEKDKVNSTENNEDSNDINGELLVKLEHENGADKFSVEIKGYAPLLMAGMQNLLEVATMKVANGDKYEAARYIEMICNNAIMSVIRKGQV